MKRISLRLIRNLALLSIVGASHAYEFPSHHRMSEAAAVDSVLIADPSVLQNLGLKDTQTFPSLYEHSSADFTDGCRSLGMYRIPQLIACGAQFEDAPNVRVLNHFFDPTNEQKLSIGGVYVPFADYTSSPEWALAPNQNELGQHHSYGAARYHLHRALTTPGLHSERAISWGLAFQALGNVIHHIQDMAQPQHVRNDQHLDLPIGEFDIPYLENPSLFEASTAKLLDELESLLLNNRAQPIYPGLHSEQFRIPRDFWKNSSGTGIATWTNENFVSLGTNFDSGRYSLPTPAVVRHVPHAELSPPLNPGIRAVCDGYPTACVMTFIATNLGQPAYVEKASTLSIFDQYMTVLHPGQHVFTLNEYNFIDIRARTMPTAVSYSAGLINYFFRGKLEISLPQEGVYAILDHAVENQRDTNGFRKIKARVRNVTSSRQDDGGNPIVEPMALESPGALRAVVRFHRNFCYQPDLSGEYGSPGIDWRACRSQLEETIVSDPVNVTSAINGAGQQVSFSFANAPIPINATDIRLQVVYRGGLGSEADAVVAATKDISEPSYLYNYSRWDQYSYCTYWPTLSVSGTSCTTRHSYAEWCTGGGAFPTVEACNEAQGLTRKYQFSPTPDPIPGYDPAANPAVPPNTWITDMSRQTPFSPAAIMRAPVGTLTRIAVLADVPPNDPEPLNALLRVEEQIDTTHETAGFEWFDRRQRPTITQFDSSTQTLTPSATYLPGRGVFLYSSEHSLLTSGDASPMPNLIIVPSEIIF